MLDEPAKRVDAASFCGDRDMVGATRQGSALIPEVGHRGIDVVVGPIDGTFAIAAHDMHPFRTDGGPGHFAAWDRKRGAADPTTRRAGRNWTVEDTLRFLIRRQMVRHATLEASIGVCGGPQLRQGRLRV
nr:hypothetical protein ABAZ39_21950 [Azospirillum argentinense]